MPDLQSIICFIMQFQQLNKYLINYCAICLLKSSFMNPRSTCLSFSFSSLPQIFCVNLSHFYSSYQTSKVDAQSKLIFAIIIIMSIHQSKLYIIYYSNIMNSQENIPPPYSDHFDKVYPSNPLNREANNPANPSVYPLYYENNIDHRVNYPIPPPDGLPINRYNPPELQDTNVYYINKMKTTGFLITVIAVSLLYGISQIGTQCSEENVSISTCTSPITVLIVYDSLAFVYLAVNILINIIGRQKLKDSCLCFLLFRKEDRQDCFSFFVGIIFAICSFIICFVSIALFIAFIVNVCRRNQRQNIAVENIVMHPYNAEIARR